MGMYGFLPVVLIVGAIALAVGHMWVLAAILLVMGVFGVCLGAMYNR